jgi:hypothetical protein
LALGKKEDFWRTLRDCNVGFLVTAYPVNIDYEAIDRKAAEYGIPYHRFVEIWNKNDTKNEKLMRRDPLSLRGNRPRHEFISCYLFNDCLTLRHGRISTCPISVYAEHFNSYFTKSLNTIKQNSINIYEAATLEEIAEFCTQPIPFCRHCKVRERNFMPYAVSGKNVAEWTDEANFCDSIISTIKKMMLSLIKNFGKQRIVPVTSKKEITQ